MLYDSLKIIHIISATLLMTSLSYCYYLWGAVQRPSDQGPIAYKIQSQTWNVLFPVMILQLATGFYMLSLKHQDFTQFWVVGSAIGLVIAIASWFSFIYTLTLSQQLTINTRQHTNSQFKSFRLIQFVMLSICAVAVFSMIFLMANSVN